LRGRSGRIPSVRAAVAARWSAVSASRRAALSSARAAARRATVADRRHRGEQYLESRRSRPRAVAGTGPPHRAQERLSQTVGPSARPSPSLPCSTGLDAPGAASPTAFVIATPRPYGLAWRGLSPSVSRMSPGTWGHDGASWVTAGKGTEFGTIRSSGGIDRKAWTVARLIMPLRPSSNPFSRSSSKAPVSTGAFFVFSRPRRRVSVHLMTWSSAAASGLARVVRSPGQSRSALRSR
jgi:hypothetical protein